MMVHSIHINVYRHGFFTFRHLLIIACFIWGLFAIAACNNKSHKHSISSVLLFNGNGVSANDVTAIETILDSVSVEYSTVNSADLNAMSCEQLLNHRVLIIPGGDFMLMGNSLTKASATNIRKAVQGGLNYLGICAGAFLAGNSTYYNGFNLASGVKFGFYTAESDGMRKAAVAISFPGSPTMDQYWEDGPQLSGWGAVVAKYPDATAAITEGKCGKGYVILVGIHPEAPAKWRGDMIFRTPVSDDNTYAGTLIQAALKGKSLQHY